MLEGHHCPAEHPGSVTSPNPCIQNPPLWGSEAFSQQGDRLLHLEGMPCSSTSPSTSWKHVSTLPKPCRCRLQSFFSAAAVQGAFTCLAIASTLMMFKPKTSLCSSLPFPLQDWGSHHHVLFAHLTHPTIDGKLHKSIHPIPWLKPPPLHTL